MRTVQPSVIGPYQIKGTIGQGGMATVYQAYNTQTRQVVALKVLLPQYRQQSDIAERFRREGHNAVQLQHPHIVQVYESNVMSGTPYIAMAYIKGNSLEAWLRKHKTPLPLDYAANVLMHIASALDYAHRRGVVHRDVKSNNILIDEQWHAYLTDFGIAQAAGQSRITHAGGPVGTPTYMSPEQIKGGDIDPRTDVYALGIVAYEMVTGRTPFQSDTPTAVLYQQVNEPPLPPRQFNPALSPKAEKVILKALAKKPARRYQTTGEFAKAFWDAVAPKLQVPVPTGSNSNTSPPPQPGRGQKRAPQLGLGYILPLVGLLLLVFLGMIAGNQHNASPRLSLPSEEPTVVISEQESPSPTPHHQVVTAPKLLAPEDNASVSGKDALRLSWSNVILQDDQRYRVEVKEAVTNESIFLPRNGIIPKAEHELKVTDMDSGKYYWRVKVEQQREGEWALVTQTSWSAFEVTRTAAATVASETPSCLASSPSLVSPRNDSTHYGGIEVQFQWSGGRLCTGQQWRVMIKGQYAECAPTTANSVTCKTPSVTQKEQTEWQVVVVNTSGQRTWQGDSKTFSIWLAAP